MNAPGTSSSSCQSHPLPSNFELVKELGRGAFGVVLLCRQTVEDEDYALKFVNFSNHNFELRVREVRLFRQLRHPNIVEYRNSWTDGTVLIIQMQFCEGGTLHEKIASGHFVNNTTAIESILPGLLQALKFLHSRKEGEKSLIYRDIKPANILFSKGVAKLGDFGLLTELREDATAGAGTYLYQAPEAVTSNYTTKVDVYSLGLVTFELYASSQMGVPTRTWLQDYRANHIFPENFGQNLSKSKQRWTRGLITKMTRPNPAERLSAEQILQEFFVAAQESKTTHDRVASPSLYIQGYSSGSSGFTPTTITSSSEAAYAQLESVALLPTRSDSTNSRAFNSVKPSRKISERCGGHLPCLSFGLFVILLLALTALAIRLFMRGGIPSVESSMITTTTPESLEPRVEAVQIKPQEGAKPTKQSIVPSCPTDWRYMAKTKSCYFKIPQMKTYPAAAKECKNLGSSLVSIHSRDEAEFVDDVGGKYYYWIGLNTTRGRRFEWLDGTDLDYQNWEQGRNETEVQPSLSFHLCRIGPRVVWLEASPPIARGSGSAMDVRAFSTTECARKAPGHNLLAEEQYEISDVGK